MVLSRIRSKQRHKFEIVKDMIESVKYVPLSKWRLIRRANVPDCSCRQYFETVLDAQLIRENNGVYLATEKGLIFLLKFRQFERLFK